LTCYEIEGKGGKREVVVENQFGEQTLTVEEPELLCVPSGKTAVVLRSGESWGSRSIPRHPKLGMAPIAPGTQVALMSETGNLQKENTIKEHARVIGGG
jgi:hypothetical protein